MDLSGQRHDPAAHYPRGKDTGTLCTGGWVGPRADLDTKVREKISCPCRRSNLDLLFKTDSQAALPAICFQLNDMIPGLMLFFFQVFG
jgi:hypothetical protein